jgi:dTDP-glucose 4,6-dehydratase
MSKKILITGGAGFIGHQAVEKFLKLTDYSILIMDRLSYAGDLNRINDIISEVGDQSRSRIEFVYHDLKAPLSDELLKKLDGTNIVLHIGASSHVTRSVENPSIFIQDNVVGTFNLLEAARKLDSLELFYYFSTDEVFGPSDEDVKFKEWDRYNSKNPYSATKAAGEELTIAYSNTYSIPSLITHCCNVYGQRQNNEKFIPNTIKKILSKEKIIVHTDENNVPGSRYYIHNEDLAESIVFLTTNHEEVRSESIKQYQKEPAKINITGDSLITNLEVVEMIGNDLKMKFEYELENKDSLRPGHDIKYGLDNTLIKSINGHHDREFKMGISDVVNWYLKNKNWLN